MVMTLPDTEDSSDQRSSLDSSRIDNLNLEQALLDFEIANARVLDLTHRLTTLTSDLLGARQELETTRVALSQANSELAAFREENHLIKASLAYRGLRFMGDIRARLLR